MRNKISLLRGLCLALTALLSPLPVLPQTAPPPTAPLSGAERVTCVQAGMPRGCTATQLANTATNIASGAQLGTPASITLTNATGLPLDSGVTGTLPITHLPVGTSGATLPVLNAANSWSGTQTFTADVTATAGSNTFSIVNPRKLTNALAAGLDPTGTTSISAALQSLINAGVGVYFPCGTYLTSATVTVQKSGVGIVGESAACVTFARASDFGPVFAFANAGGPVTNERLSGFTVSDTAALAGTAGYATCANSPFHITWDGVQYSVIDDVRFAMGCGGLAIRGGYNVWLSHTQYFFNPITGASSQSGAGTALYVGYSGNPNLSAAQSANIWVQDADIECGSGVAATKCQYGYVIDGADGVFNRSVHVEYAQAADFHFANNTGKYMVNISCGDCFADITPGIGLLLDGASPVSNLQFSGSVDAAGLNTANPGISISGGGGLNNSLLDVHVRGWGTQGILANASNTANLVIRPHDFTINNVSGSAGIADIDIEQGSNITIQGGTLDGYGTSAPRVVYGIQLGAGVTGANVVGVASRRHSGVYANILNGASNIVFTGGDGTGNSVAGIQVLGPAGSVSVLGTLGVPWTAYTPAIACGAGTITTLGTVAGSYVVKGKTLAIQLSIPITTIGTCASSITASLPAGLTSAAATVIFGRDVAASGKALTGSIGGAGGTSIQIQTYDNSFAGASGANLVLNGEIQIQ